VLPLARENEGEKEALIEERVNIRDLHQTIEDAESDLDSFDGDELFSRYREQTLAQKNDENLSRRGLAKASKVRGIDGVLVTQLDCSNGWQEILQELHHLARRHCFHSDD
jgi:hypothetical protein